MSVRSTVHFGIGYALVLAAFRTNFCFSGGAICLTALTMKQALYDIA